MTRTNVVLLLSSLLLLQGNLVSTLNTNLTYRIPEESPEGHFVGDLGRDSDFARRLSDLKKPLVYELFDDTVSYFRLDKLTGRVLVNSRVDREALCPNQNPCIYTFSVMVSQQIWINIHIFIEDVNDNIPAFSEPTKVIAVKEDAKQNSHFPLSLAQDEDVGPNSFITYTLSDQTHTFSVAHQPPYTLNLVLKASGLDFERVSSYNLTLIACDAGRPKPLCGRQLLLVQLEDINDNKPEFQVPRPGSATNERPAYSVIVLENATVGSVLLRVHAVDRDSGKLGHVRYQLSNLASLAAVRQFFAVNADTGEILLRERLDAKKNRRFSFLVEAVDGGNPPSTSQATVEITVLDVNDHGPNVKLKPPSGEVKVIQIVENSPPGTSVGLVFASDDDLGQNGVVGCHVPNSNPYFELRHSNNDGQGTTIYQVLTKLAVDREEQPRVLLQIVCQDHGEPPLRTDVTEDVPILDQNEFPPRFRLQNYTTSIPENIALRKAFLNVRALDDDADAQLKYSLNVEGQQFFHIDEKSADVSALVPLDREVTPKINFVVYVTDSRFSASTAVVVELEDVNDMAPRLEGPNSFSVQESQGEQATFGQLIASDPDLGPGGEVRFRLNGVQVRHPQHSDRTTSRPIYANSTFSIKPTGAIVAMESLDREKYEFYDLTVVLYDLGTPSLSSTATVGVQVMDLNDNEPAWIWPAKNHQRENLTGPISSHTKMATVRASDPDSKKNANITYHLLEGSKYFQLHSITGDLYTTLTLTNELVRLRIRAQDNGEPMRYSDRILIVSVIPASEWDSYGEEGSGVLQGLWQILQSTSGIVIALLLGTGLILTLLLITIVVVRRRNRRYLRDKQLRKWVNENQYSDDVYRHQRPPGAPPGIGYFGPPGPPGPPSSNSLKHRLLATSAAAATPQMSEKAFQDSQTLHVRSLMLSPVVGCGDMLEVNSADSGHGASEEDQPLNADSKVYRTLYQPGVAGGGISILGNPYPTLSEESTTDSTSSFLAPNMVTVPGGQEFTYHYNPMYGLQQRMTLATSASPTPTPSTLMYHPTMYQHPTYPTSHNSTLSKVIHSTSTSSSPPVSQYLVSSTPTMSHRYLGSPPRPMDLQEQMPLTSLSNPVQQTFLYPSRMDTTMFGEENGADQEVPLLTPPPPPNPQDNSSA